MLGAVRETAPRRFEALLVDAIARDSPHGEAEEVARTLISTSIRIKHRVTTPGACTWRMRVALRLVLA